MNTTLDDVQIILARDLIDLFGDPFERLHTNGEATASHGPITQRRLAPGQGVTP